MFQSYLNIQILSAFSFPRALWCWIFQVGFELFFQMLWLLQRLLFDVHTAKLQIRH